MRRAAAVLLSAALAAAGPGAVPAAAAAEQPAAIGISLVDGPTDDRGGLAQDRISHVIPAGESAQWTVEVANTGSQPVTASVYAGAASLEGGQLRPAADDQEGELVTWLTTDPAEPEVPAGGTVEVEVDLDVPDDATDGDHAAIIWAAASSGHSEAGIEQVNRIGIRALITVADGQPAASFEIEQIRAEAAADGTGDQVVVDVTNTGGRMLEVGGTLNLTDGPGGVSASEMPLPPTTIRTGATAPVAVPVDSDLPAGEWTASAEVVGDRLSDRASATVTLGQGRVEAAEADAGQDPRAALISLAVLLLIAALIALIAARRRKTDDDQDHEPGRRLAGV